MRRYLRSFLTREAAHQFIRVGVVGVINTVVSFSLFNLFIVLFGATEGEGNDFPLFVATALSFMLATFLSYVLNRKWSFGLTEDGLSGRETAHFFVINIVALLVTAGVVNGANAVWGPLSRLQANIAYGVAALLIIIPKFAGYRDIVFRKALDGRGARSEQPSEPSGTP